VVARVNGSMSNITLERIKHTNKFFKEYAKRTCIRYYRQLILVKYIRETNVKYKERFTS